MKNEQLVKDLKVAGYGSVVRHGKDLWTYVKTCLGDYLILATKPGYWKLSEDLNWKSYEIVFNAKEYKENLKVSKWKEWFSEVRSGHSREQKNQEM